MALPNNQRVFCNPVLVYALNVFVLHWIRAYDRPTCKYSWSTLAFASSFSSSGNGLNIHSSLDPSRKLLTSWSSFSRKLHDGDAGNETADSPSHSSSSSIFDELDDPSPPSIFDRLDDHFSNIVLDLRKKIQSDDILNLISDKIFSPETAKAIKSVWTLLSNVSDHGIVDVFATYPARDVAVSILAFSRLQHISQFQMDVSKLNASSDQMVETQQFLRQERALIDDLAYYAVFAGVAYGWKLHLLLKQQLHLGDTEALTQRTGIDARNIISQNWISRTHLPAYFIVRDVERERIVLCIRGTLSAKDILTDLCCTAEDFTMSESPEKFSSLFRRPTHARAHHGMLESAKGVANMTRSIISSQLAENPTYKLVIVGHSLGAGTAAVLGTLWKNTFPGLKVFAYGCPCVGPLDMDPTSNDAIVSVVGEGDPFSCLSLGHLADLSTVIGYLCQNADLRNEILKRTANKDESTLDADMVWSLDKVRELRQMMNAEKLYPPGRIIYIVVNDDSDLISIRQAPQTSFGELKLHPRMLDLSRHIPHHYEAALSKIQSKASEE